MSELIRPDVLISIPIQNGELLLSPAFDVVHRFQRFGSSILKYYDGQKGRMCNVMLTEQGADFLRNEVGLYVIERPYMTASEHEAHVEWKASHLDESEYGLGEP